MAPVKAVVRIRVDGVFNLGMPGAGEQITLIPARLNHPKSTMLGTPSFAPFNLSEYRATGPTPVRFTNTTIITTVLRSILRCQDFCPKGCCATQAPFLLMTPSN